MWWIERILYPLQAYGSYFSPPGAGMVASAVAGSGLSIGVYHYAVTLLSQGGESAPSPLVTVTTSSGNQQINLSAIPLGPSITATPGIATNQVIGRNLYRSTAGGAPLSLLTTLQDNVTTNFTDTTADNTLSGKPAPPTVNTSGVMLWPPCERIRGILQHLR